MHTPQRNPLQILPAMIAVGLLGCPLSALAQFRQRLSPDYSPDSNSILVRKTGLSRDGRWYYFFYENYSENLHFYDVATNTRWPFDTSAFTDIDPVGIASPSGTIGSYFFVFRAKEAAFPGGDYGLWAITIPLGPPIRISQNATASLPA